MMLPYMEQQPLYNAANFFFNCGYGTGNIVNSTVSLTLIRSLLCPSDGEAGLQYTNNYNGSMGTSTNCSSSTGISTGIFAAGPGGNNKTYTIATVIDGTSNTVAFSEALVGAESGTGNQEFRTSVQNVSGASSAVLYNAATNYPIVLNALQQCSTSYMSGSTLNSRGYRWAIGTNGMSIFNTIAPPNSQKYQWSSCFVGGHGLTNYDTFANATSYHSGGCNVGFVDGSVHFVKSSISIRMWWALGTRNGKEVVSANAY